METGLSVKKKFQVYEGSHLFQFLINTTGEQLLALRCENDTASTRICIFTEHVSLHVAIIRKFLLTVFRLSKQIYIEEMVLCWTKGCLYPKIPII